MELTFSGSFLLICSAELRATHDFCFGVDLVLVCLAC